jgi:hypothetical protein
MEAQGLLQPGTTCVELGAGKAGLAYAVHVAHPALPLVLVDRAAHRRPVRLPLGDIGLD